MVPSYEKPKVKIRSKEVNTKKWEDRSFLNGKGSGGGRRKGKDRDKEMCTNSTCGVLQARAKQRKQIERWVEGTGCGGDGLKRN